MGAKGCFPLINRIISYIRDNYNSTPSDLDLECEKQADSSPLLSRKYSEADIITITDSESE